MRKRNQLRIIGGKWRGRKITFPDIPSIRPTPDRVRETLFNWLAPVIHGTRCLDLFAGSGALGIEALSRGAKDVFFIDESKDAIDRLKINLELLGCENIEAHCANAENYLKQACRSFDIVFLDPPFHQNLIPKYCEVLEKNHLLNEKAYIYIETEAELKTLELPSSWKILKQQRAGQVGYYLICTS